MDMKRATHFPPVHHRRSCLWPILALIFLPHKQLQSKHPRWEIEFTQGWPEYTQCEGVGHLILLVGVAQCAKMAASRRGEMSAASRLAATRLAALQFCR